MYFDKPNKFQSVDEFSSFNYLQTQTELQNISLSLFEYDSLFAVNPNIIIYDPVSVPTTNLFHDYEFSMTNTLKEQIIIQIKPEKQPFRYYAKPEHDFRFQNADVVFEKFCIYLFCINQFENWDDDQVLIFNAEWSLRFKKIISNEESFRVVIHNCLKTFGSFNSNKKKQNDFARERVQRLINRF
jgi:hypothetical protein